MSEPALRVRAQWPATISLFGIVLILLWRASWCHGPDGHDPGGIATSRARFVPDEDGTLAVRSTDGLVWRELRVMIDLDGAGVPIPLVVEGDAGVASLDLEGTRVDARLTTRLDRERHALALVLDVPAAPGAGEHHIALRVEAPALHEHVFASGVGEIADVGAFETRAVVLESTPYPVAFAAGTALGFRTEPEGEGAPGRTTRLVALGTTLRAEEGGTSELWVVLGNTSASIWGQVHGLIGDHTERVRGVVTGARGRAHVVGLDEEGAPIVRAMTEEGGRFEIDAPTTVVRWYAGEDPTRTSAPTFFVPGTPYELRLDVSEGGELTVRVSDPDANAPLTARVFVHGIEGTLDPSFGPDYRASGAGPLADALRGEITTPLPAGKYRVSASRGLEWSVDAKEIEIHPGKHIEIDLHPRHVVPTPGVIGCDLHVHARPSFDAPVTAEDRVLSLVAAGIDFAVPTEHNLVGDYGPAIAALDLRRDLAYVSGVEITTYQPYFGHFGVFPWPTDAGVPPFRQTSPEKVIAAARTDRTRFLQVNHPRFTKRIGYFEQMGWRHDAGAPPHDMRLDFDGIEVMNGFDAPFVSRVDGVIGDYLTLLSLGHRYTATASSDSHRIQYVWAGYPRTLIDVGGADGDTAPIDPKVVVTALKGGRVTITSGPIIELTVGGGKPGDEIDPGTSVDAHVVIRAAPWVDVDSVSLLVGGKSFFNTAETLSIPSRPTQIGPELGSLEEARSRTIRLDRVVRLEVGQGATWVIAIARGTRKLDDVLPFMPVTPIAMTNPIWVKRRAP
jgi:hypothetical protein